MRIDETIYCDNCGVEVNVPEIIAGHDYCCRDCHDGIKCNCRSKVEEMLDVEQDA